jgi:hypothetical protein
MCGKIIEVCTDKKENQNFPIYKEIQNGAVAKSYITNGLLIYGEIFTHHSSRPVFLNPHRVFAQQGEPPWDAEPRFELRPALQQADALPTELRRILTN